MKKFLVKVQWSETEYENWVISANSVEEATQKALAESIWAAQVSGVHLIHKEIK